jgi:hypothetical protein
VILVEIIVNLHAFFNDTKKVALWMNTKNLKFGGASPMELIAKGRGGKVLSFIVSSLDENRREL